MCVCGVNVIYIVLSYNQYKIIIYHSSCAPVVREDLSETDHNKLTRSRGLERLDSQVDHLACAHTLVSKASKVYSRLLSFSSYWFGKRAEVFSGVYGVWIWLGV